MQNFHEYVFEISIKQNIITTLWGHVCSIFAIDEIFYIQAFFFYCVPRRLLLIARHIENSKQSNYHRNFKS